MTLEASAASAVSGAASAVPGATTAGGRLRAAREAAGLTVDAVAQQLKLAPRQVKALEDDDWARLPGRTFVRGFARNYARFVQLDPDAVVALMPPPDTVPSLERPSLAASRRPIGEMPIERVAKPSALRWLVPLLLLALLAAFAYYEFSRSSLRLPDFLSGGDSASAPRGGAPSATRPTATTSALPNPVADNAARGAPAGDAESATKVSPPAASSSIASPAATGAAPASAPTVSAAEGAAASASDASGAAAEAALVLTFKGTSWAEVKDAKGRVVLQMTGGPGMTQTVSAQAPLELALGNAPDVDVTYRGRSLDLAPYTRGSVARVALR